MPGPQSSRDSVFSAHCLQTSTHVSGIKPSTGIQAPLVCLSLNDVDGQVFAAKKAPDEGTARSTTNLTILPTAIVKLKAYFNSWLFESGIENDESSLG